jgi:hypothetical protein
VQLRRAQWPSAPQVKSTGQDALVDVQAVGAQR